MKKTIFRSVLMLVVLVSASAAMAATTITGPTTINGSTNSFQPSQKVGLAVSSAATSYAVTSCHLSGSYEYGTVGGANTVASASAIYRKTIPTQSGTVGTPDAPTTTTDLPSGYGTWTIN